MQTRWLESWRKSKLSIREAVLDDNKNRRLRLACAVAIILLAGETTLFIYYLTALDVRMEQVLRRVQDPNVEVDSFEDITLLLCIVTGVVASGVLACYSFINANKSFFFIMMCVTRVLLMVFIQVIIFIPMMLVAEQFDCGCVNGDTIAFWMNLLGSASIVVGLARFCDACTRQPPGVEELQQTAEFGGAPIARSNTIPVVYLLLSCRQVIEGLSLILASPGVRDNLNGDAKDTAWMDTLVVIVLCHGIGVILTIVMLLAKGCPTALERATVRGDKIRRTFWNLAAPTTSALARFMSVIFLFQLIRWYDNSRYYPAKHIPTAEVVFWGFGVVSCLVLIVVGLAAFLVNPGFYRECASIIERDIAVSIEASELHNDVNSTRSGRSHVASFHQLGAGAANNPLQ